MVSPSSKPRRIGFAVTLATFAIFGGLVVGLTWQMRGQLRGEVLRREAEAIQAVAIMQLQMAEERTEENDGPGDMETLFAAVLESSRLRGVLAVQLFEASGALWAALPSAAGGTVNPWWSLELKTPQGRFVATGSLEAVLGVTVASGAKSTQVPLMDIAVPLAGPANREGGVARYWMDGAPVAAEFARLDRRLAFQAGSALLAGTLLIGAVLGWAFSRLTLANRRLLEQSMDLKRANEELDFAAKTGALGAISAHLIHGLKNPLAGLEGFVAETAAAGDAPGGEACRAAVDTTRRLRALVNEVGTILREESGAAADYAVPVAELVQDIRIRAVPVAEPAGVTLTAVAEANVEIKARTANLVGLVLANLITNAIEASAPGTTVAIEAQRVGDNVEFVVRDNGAGLPQAVQDALFRPVRSEKRAGGGVGLAISHRLAKHAGGELALVHSSPEGTSFRLVVPAVNGA
jgi:signal transduction histidine kinase